MRNTEVEEKDKKKAKAKVFDTDDLFNNLGVCMVRDFRSTLNQPDFCQDFYDRVSKGGIAASRYAVFPSYSGAEVRVFKRYYQIQNLYKRYISTRDFMTPRQRMLKTFEKFQSVQCIVDNPPPITHRAFLVIQRARKIIKKILGEFSQQELLSYCSFGTRANAGVPYSQSYLDNKMSMLSGTPDQITWFINTYLPTDKILERSIGLGNNPPVSVIDSLQLVTVPKKYEIDRTVMPNTVLGTFHSNAVARMIEERLSANGLHIPSLQYKHGILAQRGSRTGRLATGDLSSASDLPGFALMCRLIPRSWLTELKRGRCGYVTVNGRRMKLASFMGMGIGFTFPVETLIFYALLKSIAALSNTSGTISVYGDDLIYPSGMASYVRQIFGDLGLIFNKEKSFSTGNFRESCGHDYLYGRDVRPFQPEVIGGEVSRLEYLALLYKCYNGLLRRWNATDIPSVVHFLQREILRVDFVHYVPLLFPDTAGLRMFPGKLPWYVPSHPVVCDWTLQQDKFFYLVKRAEPRTVQNQSAYYWNALRISNNTEERLFYQSFIDPIDIVQINWRIAQYKIRTSSGSLNAMWPTVPDKSKGAIYTSNIGHTSVWSEAVL